MSEQEKPSLDPQEDKNKDSSEISSPKDLENSQQRELQKELKEDADIAVMDDIGNRLEDAISIMTNTKGCILALMEDNLNSVLKLIKDARNDNEKAIDCIDIVVIVSKHIDGKCRIDSVSEVYIGGCKGFDVSGM